MTNSVVGALRVNLGLDSAQFSEGLKSAQQSLKKTGQQMRNVGAALSVAVTAPLAIAARDMVRLASVQESAEALVRQGVEATGRAAGFSAAELFKMAAGLQEVSKYGDEQILSDVSAQLLTFTNVTGEEFARAQQAILDVATVLDQDLKSVAIQVGKALNDPVAGLSALSESGIQFTEEQKELIKALVETGDKAGAQGVILDELAKQYGGQASAQAETFAGKVVQLGNAWGDLKEEFGAILNEFLPPLIEAIRGVIDFVRELDPETKELAVKIAAVAAAIGPVLVGLGFLLIGLSAVSAPVLAVVAGITALTTGFFFFRDEIGKAVGAVRNFAENALEYIRGLPEQIVGAFAGLADRMVQVGRDILEGLMRGLREKYEEVKSSIAGFATGLVDGVKEKLGIQSPSTVFRGIGVNIMEGLNIGLSETGAIVEDTMRGVTSSLSREVSGLFKAVLFQGQSFKSALGNLLGSIGGRFLDKAFDGLFGALGFDGFAAGTNYAPGGLAMVGERGPELMYVPRGAQITPNHELASLGSGGTSAIRVELGEGLVGQVLAQARGQTVQIVQGYDRQMPGRVSQILNDPMKR